MNVPLWFSKWFSNWIQKMQMNVNVNLVDLVKIFPCRQIVHSNEYLVAKIGFNTDENEDSKVGPSKLDHTLNYFHSS